MDDCIQAVNSHFNMFRYVPKSGEPFTMYIFTQKIINTNFHGKLFRWIWIPLVIVVNIINLL